MAFDTEASDVGELSHAHQDKASFPTQPQGDRGAGNGLNTQTEAGAKRHSNSKDCSYGISRAIVGTGH